LIDKTGLITSCQIRYANKIMIVLHNKQFYFIVYIIIEIAVAIGLFSS